MLNGFMHLWDMAAQFNIKKFMTFVVSGGFNTLVTYLLYLGLIQFMPYKIAFTLMYAFGIGLSYFLNRRFVFGKPDSGKRIFLFPGVYLIQYILSLVIVTIWVEHLGWYKELAPLVATALTLPVTFLTTQWVFKPHKDNC